jgi:hypothetical protein
LLIFLQTDEEEFYCRKQQQKREGKGLHLLLYVRQNQKRNRGVAVRERAAILG